MEIGLNMFVKKFEISFMPNDRASEYFFVTINE